MLFSFFFLFLFLWSGGGGDEVNLLGYEVGKLIFSGFGLNFEFYTLWISIHFLQQFVFIYFSGWYCLIESVAAIFAICAVSLWRP